MTGKGERKVRRSLMGAEGAASLVCLAGGKGGGDGGTECETVG